MDLKQAAKLGRFLSRNYAEGVLGMLARYQTVSASEAASRLGLHIHTVQESLNILASCDIVSKTKVRESKRPYFRYGLTQPVISLQIDLAQIPLGEIQVSADSPIKESMNANVRFALDRRENTFTSVTLWEGTGRALRERKIRLTKHQGKFLFYLPVPYSAALTVQTISERANIDAAYLPEIKDIVGLLIEHRAIDALSLDSP